MTNIKYIYIYDNPLNGNAHIQTPTKVKFINKYNFYEVNENNERLLTFIDSYDPVPDRLAPIQDIRYFKYKIFNSYKDAMNSFIKEELKRSRKLILDLQDKLLSAMKEEVRLENKKENIEEEQSFINKRPSFRKEITMAIETSEYLVIEIVGYIQKYSKFPNISLNNYKLNVNSGEKILDINIKTLEIRIQKFISNELNIPFNKIKNIDFLILLKKED